MMKKIIAIIIVLSASLTLQAQGEQKPYNMFQDSYMVDQVMRTLAVLAVFTLLAVFIITIVRTMLDYRLKNKMIEKGVSENLAFQFLRTTKRTEKSTIIKWVCILFGVGTGLSIITFYQPYGIHSLAIMIFCIAAGLLGFFFYLKQTGEQ